MPFWKKKGRITETVKGLEVAVGCGERRMKRWSRESLEQ
jgi:hypothetical protein